MRAAVYLRVSTVDQDPETQGREVRAFVTGRGWDLAETYQDVGISGAKSRRPALDRLLKDAWQGGFQAVVVWDLSRMARSTLNALQLLTPLGRAFFTLAAMFAELEREILIERVRAGMARARAEGKRIGRPERRVDLEELRRLRGERLTIRQIARRMGIPRSTVAKRLAAAPSAREASA